MPQLAVVVPGGATAAALLVAAHAALGGGDFGPRPVADPCAQRARPQGVERTQLAALAILDGAACKLAVSREDFLRTLLESGGRPARMSEDELADAFGAGVERARDEEALGRFVAEGLKLRLRAGFVDEILDFVLPD